MKLVDRLRRKIAYALDTKDPEGRDIRQVPLFGKSLLVFANDNAGRTICFDNGFELAESHFLQKNVRKKDICLDVGAGIGYYTVLMGNLAGDGAVHAFEPEHFKASLLKTNLALNGIENTTVNEHMVSEKDGKAEFILPGTSEALVAEGKQKNPGKVMRPAITLDSYMEKQGLRRLDILKIDTDGAESQVLKGAKSLLAGKQSRPRILMLHLNDTHLKGFGSSVQEIITKLTASGYDPYIIHNEQGDLRRFVNNDIGAFKNFVFLNRNTD